MYQKFRQPSSRQWSQWIELAKTTYVACCDCGLVHAHQFRGYLLDDKSVKVVMRTRRHKARTAERRKQKRHRYTAA
jgi:hypothetical protein